MADVDITVDANVSEASSKLSKLDSQANGIGSKASSAWLGRIGTGAAAAGRAVAKAAAGAVAVTGAAAAAIGAAALSAYADYEQLVGGVETLYGTSAGRLQELAANAYQTAGLSANAYMEQATSFAAALTTSLGGDTERAVAYADMAIQDMSDNANRMGTDVSRIQDAYQGFAKQNYTMLDNLKLGYGGTKTEMERLLADAEAISGIHYDISNYADVVAAIHVIQQEMRITGTTAREAATTIQGSVASMRAAWTNWLVGLGDDDADMAALTEQLVESIGTAAGNVMPRVAEIMATMVQAVPDALGQLFASAGEWFAPLAEAVSELPIGEALLAALDAAPGVIAGALATAADWFAPLLDEIRQLPVAAAFAECFSRAFDGVDLGGTLMGALGADSLGGALSAVASPLEDLGSAVSGLLGTALGGIGALVEPLIPVLVNLGSAVLPVLTGAIDAVNGALQFVLAFVRPVVDVVAGVLAVALSAVQPLLQGVGDALSWVGEQLGSAATTWTQAVGLVASAFSGLVTTVSQLPAQVLAFLSGVAATVASWAAQLVSGAVGAGSGFLSGVVGFLAQVPGSVAGYLASVVASAASFVGSFAAQAASAASSFAASITSGLAGLPGQMLSIGADIVRGVADGITGAIGNITSAIAGVGDAIVGGLSSLLGIASPSKVMRDEVGRWIPLGVVAGIDETMPDLDAAITHMVDVDGMASSGRAAAVSGPVYQFVCNDAVVNGTEEMEDTFVSLLGGLVRRYNSLYATA